MEDKVTALPEQLRHVVTESISGAAGVAGHLGADWMPADAEERFARGAERSNQEVWFVDDDTALLIRDPAQEPTVVSSGRWRRYGVDGSLVAAR